MNTSDHTHSGHTHLIIQDHDQGVGVIGHEGRAATNPHLFWYNGASPQEYWDLETNVLDLVGGESDASLRGRLALLRGALTEYLLPPLYGV